MLKACVQNPNLVCLPSLLSSTIEHDCLLFERINMTPASFHLVRHIRRPFSLTQGFKSLVASVSPKYNPHLNASRALGPGQARTLLKSSMMDFKASLSHWSVKKSPYKVIAMAELTKAGGHRLRWWNATPQISRMICRTSLSILRWVPAAVGCFLHSFG